MRERRGEAAEGVIGLVFATLILYFLDPVISQAFSTALSDPAFANSPAGAIWTLLAFVFSLHLDIIVLWIGVVLSLGGKR